MTRVSVTGFASGEGGLYLDPTNITEAGLKSTPIAEEREVCLAQQVLQNPRDSLDG